MNSVKTRYVVSISKRMKYVAKILTEYVLHYHLLIKILVLNFIKVINLIKSKDSVLFNKIKITNARDDANVEYVFFLIAHKRQTPQVPSRVACELCGQSEP